MAVIRHASAHAGRIVDREVWKSTVDNKTVSKKCGSQIRMTVMATQYILMLDGSNDSEVTKFSGLWNSLAGSAPVQRNGTRG